MSRKRKVSKLQAELESFGRCAKGLTADNLESSPGVLEALFGEDALADPDERLRLAEQVCEALMGIIGAFRDATDRHVANVMFAAEDELHHMDVSDRLKHMLSEKSLDLYALYYPRRKKLLPRVVGELRKAFISRELPVSGVVLSAEAQRAARQLYRYAQESLVRVEAYDLCIRFADGLRGNFCWARRMQVDLKHIPHGWLGEYGKGDDSFRLAPTTRSSESDPALWALAYCHRYLRALLRDPTGRDYLRENLPIECWRSIQLGAPFQPGEIDKVLSVLAEGQIDDAYAFVDNLCQDGQGRSIYEKWLELLTTETSRAENWGKSADARQLTQGDRGELVFDLLMLCIALQTVFPKETLISPEEDSRLAIAMIIEQGLLESQKPEEEYDYEKESKLVDHLLRLRPPMYLSEEDEFVWSDELPEHDPWAEFH